MLKPFSTYMRGVSIPSKSTRMLLGGKGVLFGNTISEHFNLNRRMWKPNVLKKQLWSETLEMKVKVHCTAHALRCIDKAGGIDNYMLGTFNPEDGATMNKLRRKILSEIRRREWEAANPIEAQAFKEKVAKELAEKEAAEELAKKKSDARNFSHIPSREDMLLKYKTGKGIEKWSRNW